MRWQNWLVDLVASRCNLAGVIHSLTSLITRRPICTYSEEVIVGAESDLPRAAALAALILAPQEWRHRRVESIQFSGDSGRRRISVDCTVPRDDRLLWRSMLSDEVQVVVPLGLFTKGALRDFDATGDDGRPLPMLGMEDSAALSADILMFSLVNVDHIGDTPELREAVRDLALSRPDEKAIEAFLAEGVWKGQQVLGGEDLASVGLASQALLQDIAWGFFVFVLLQLDNSGCRQVLKMSHHWTIEGLLGGRPNVKELIARVWSFVKAASGLQPAILSFPVPALADYASFHLELHLPSEIVCESLALPDGARGGSSADRDALPVAHVHGAYGDRRVKEQQEWTADAALGTRFRGTFAVALVTAWGSFLFFLLSMLFPGAIHVLRNSQDPASLLLALPVAVLGIFLGVRETPISSSLLDPLRLVVLACAVLIFVAAAALAWKLRDPWFWVLWWTGLVFTGTSVCMTTCGALARLRRSRRKFIR